VVNDLLTSELDMGLFFET